MGDEKSHKDLIEEAKKLGINYVAKKTEDLAALIKEAKSNKEEGSDEAPPKTEATEAKKESVVDPLKTKRKFDTVVVSQGKMEIRRYTQEIHGKDFAKLAGKFAKDRGFSLEALSTEDMVKCPSCGHAFDL
ncbi:hypothetical protein LCGC14_2965640 [marine sediment metagenome]|uniref:Uncharacterized protein n=1 Tax=marine sediment metagenome TaxID=412755 RepID=A0A0F9A274_9ZZZZ